MSKNGSQSLTMKNKRSDKLANKNKLEVHILIGTLNGYFKMIRFIQNENLEESSIKVQTLKLDHSSIVCINILDPEYFFDAKVCLVLSQTNRVYLVNFEYMKTLAFFMSTIVACDVGLSLSVHYESKYFVHSTEGGYIIFWDFSNHILDLIKQSMQNVVK